MSISQKSGLRLLLVICLSCFLIGGFVGAYIASRLYEHGAAPTVIPAKTLVDAVKTEEAKTAVRIDTLNGIAKRLQTSADNVKKSYPVLAEKARRDMDSLRKYVDFVRDSATMHSNAVTPDVQLYLDEVEDNSRQKDSLFYSAVDTLEKLVVVKDSIIMQKDTSYAVLKRAFVSSIDNSSALSSQIAELEKKVRKKRISATGKAALFGGLVYLISKIL